MDIFRIRIVGLSFFQLICFKNWHHILLVVE